MGIFSENGHSIFTRYQAEIKVKYRLMGGIPKDPKLMEGWLYGKGVRDEDDRRQFVLRTIRDLGHEVPESASYEDAIKLMESIADLKGSAFKKNEQGLYIESRQPKAMLREVVNIVFGDRDFVVRKIKSGERKGEDYTKQFKNAFVERVFVDPQRIHLMRDGKPIMQADGVETRVGHIGSRSVIDRNEYVDEPKMAFQVSVLKDFLTPEDWSEIWQEAECIGIGAVRSQDYGKFDINAWTRLEPGDGQ